MISVSGVVPSILYNEIEDNDNLINKGSDIDITINSNGRITTLSAITVGNGKWEIEELDDNANLFPEYENADIISFDVLKKVLCVPNSVNSSKKIYSFNLLGKVRYGLADIDKQGKANADKIKGKLGKIKNFFTDDLDKDTAQEYIRKYYNGANLGQIEKINEIDGATFKVLFGVPSEKKFYVGCLHRNGNDIRFLDDDDFADTPLYSFQDGNAALNAYENYPDIEGTDEDPDNANGTEDNENTVENITDEQVQNIISSDPHYSNFMVVDYEINENEIIVLAAQNDPDFAVGVFRINNSKIEEGQTFPIYNQDVNELKMAIDNAISKYKEFGGKKDLSYLYDSFGTSNNEERMNHFNKDDAVDVEHEIAAALRKKKKSKYNGLNVTGYENVDGSLAPVSSCHNLFSKVLLTPIFNDLKSFLMKIKTKNVTPDVEQEFNRIKELLLKISKLDSNLLKEMTNKSTEDVLVIDLSKSNTNQHDIFYVLFYNDRIIYYCSTYKNLKNEERQELLEKSLEAIADKLEYA